MKKGSVRLIKVDRFIFSGLIYGFLIFQKNNQLIYEKLINKKRSTIEKDF